MHGGFVERTFGRTERAHDRLGAHLLPNLPGVPRTAQHSVEHALSVKGVPTILLVAAAFVIAHNILYPYIAVYLADIGLAAQTGWILYVFGALAVLGIFVVGTYIDRHLRKLIVISAVLFAAAELALALLSGAPAVVYLATAAWGLAFGRSATLFTTAIVNASGPAGDVAHSVLISVFSGSIAAGGLISGLLLGGYGPNALVNVCIIFVATAASVTIAAKRYAFPLD